MPTVTVDGEKAFEVEPEKKLVLAIEDAGIDIMHRCGGNAALHHLPRRSPGRRLTPDGGPRTRTPTRENRPRSQHPPVVPDPVESDLWVRVVNRSSVQGIPPGTRPLD